MARTTFNIARGEAAAIQTLGFSVVQPANTRPLSYSSVNMAQQFAQVCCLLYTSPSPRDS